MDIDSRMKRFKEQVRLYNKFKNIGEGRIDYTCKDEKDYEIITWIDVLHIIYRAMNKAEEIRKNSTSNITIIQEYCIYSSNNNRIDIMLTKGSNILLVEFSYWYKDKEPYVKKFAQVATYKSMLEQDLPKDINIKIFVLPYKAEWTEDSKPIESDLEKRIEELSNKIVNFFDDNKALKAIDH